MSLNHSLLGLAFVVTSSGLNTSVADEKLYPWHPLTLSFSGPQASETDAVNPFTDYRLLVTFRQGYTAINVRGFYAADGKAANSHATSGNVWQVRFAPPVAGKWTYSAELRQGTDIAISDAPSLGETLPLSNASGSFIVADIPPGQGPTRDLRHQGGVLRTDGHYFQFGSNGPRILKVGANSPENLLAYRDFDDTYRIAPNDRDGEAKATETIHRYEPHLGDWRDGDPTWAEGKGKSLIGAVNYLASTGMNSVYFLTMNIGGDGKDVWPYASPDNFTRFDCSKLD